MLMFSVWRIHVFVIYYGVLSIGLGLFQEWLPATHSLKKILLEFWHAVEMHLNYIVTWLKLTVLANKALGVQVYLKL